MIPDMGSFWGESYFKAVSADYQSGADYLSSMNSKENLVGAPMSKLFAVVDYSGWEVQMIPAEYRKLDTSYVNTLMINGNLDVSTPLANAQELIGYLPNGNLVVLTDRGHQDLGLKQREEFRKMIIEYYLTGNVNDEGFNHIPAYLGPPKQSPQKFGKLFYTLKRLGLSKLALKFMQ